MSTSSSDPDGGERFNVRLNWPGEPPSDDAGPDEPTGGTPGAGLGPDVVLRPSSVHDAGEPGGGALRRVVVDSYDRLADRVLDRLRMLREDIDADLAELRSEMVAVRQAVDDLSDRVQLRQLRSSVDELRSDVSGLRRAVLEWPELERVSSDVTALRADVADLLSRPVEGSGGSGTPSLPLLAPLLEEIARLRADLPGPEPVLQEFAALRDEVTSLRRRISLRVGSGSDETELSDAQIEQLAKAVAVRVGEAIERHARR